MPAIKSGDARRGTACFAFILTKFQTLAEFALWQTLREPLHT